MQYFTLASASITPRNNLQKRVGFLLIRWHQVLTNDPYQVQTDLRKILEQAHQQFPKCKPMHLHESGDGFRQGHVQYTYWLGVEGEANTMMAVNLYRVQPIPLPLVTDEPVAPAPTSAEIEVMAGGIWIGENIATLGDGPLISVRRSYEALAETRRSGQEIEHLGEPFRSYPAEVWERCAALADTEIKRRTLMGKEVSDALENEAPID